MADDDAMITRIGRAKTLAENGDRHGARALFETLWAEATSAGDELHACVVAHFMAHAQDAPEAQLDWHLRALRAADAVGDDRVVGFYPSLHANLGDTYLRLGDLPHARQHIEKARDTEHVLERDGYGQMMRSLIARLTEATKRGGPAS